MSNTSNVRSPVSCFSIFAIMLTCLFIGLKLAAIITWSWWLVLLPIIIYGGVGFLVLGAIIIAAIVASMLDSK